MSQGKHERENRDSVTSDVVGTIMETGASVLGEAYLGPVGKAAASAAVRIVSRHGKTFITYWINRNPQEVSDSINSLKPKGGSLPPFAVIGLGRCGSHITAELAHMVAVANRSGGDQETRKKPDNFIRQLFKAQSPLGVLAIEPVMVVGDIDETTFADVSGLLQEGDEESSVASRILQIDYQPLAVGGAGNVPLFAEFFTRGLLSLPPQNKESAQRRDKDVSRGERAGTPWEAARTYLIDSCSSDSLNNPRLVFYIFSAGGGTGAGSAAEIMRAQRYAMTSSTQADPQIYFSGVAILPSDLNTNRTHLVNTGRTITQYLADLNIQLDTSEAYFDSPHFQTAFITQIPGQAEMVPMMPWDGLALISNDVMSLNEGGVDQGQAEIDANQYIAQQTFNLAASQMSADKYQIGDGGVNISKRLFQSIRLDPQDLRTGLVGPYAICFSAGEALKGNSLDRMFVRAISLPQYNDNQRKEHTRIIEGISIAPEPREHYQERVKHLSNKVLGDDTALLAEEDLSGFRELELFKRCPRLLFVLTSPQEGEIPSSVVNRLINLTSWLMPNVSQARYALIRGTTAFYTLSIYVEGSVVLCPDIQKAITNYFKLCWKQRGSRAEDFKEQYEALIGQPPPIDVKQIAEWLGDTESYKSNVPNFDNIVSGLNTRWLAFVSNSGQTSEERKAELRKHTVESTYLTVAEVAAAIRYINYAKHFSQPEIID